MEIFNLPDLGEGLPDAEIVTWHVKVGDKVSIDQPIVAMETAKAVVDVPAPLEGIVTKLHGDCGDIIRTGAPLIEFEELLATPKSPITTHKSPTDSTIKPSQGEEKRKDTGTVAGKLEESNTKIATNLLTVSGNKYDAKISPSVKALARKHKVDLKLIKPTGNNNTITKDDILKSTKTSAKVAINTSQEVNNSNQQKQSGELLRGSRRIMAQTMQQSHASVVPVTIFDDAAIYKWDKEQDITTRLIKAIEYACKLEPALNAWFDEQHLSRELKPQLDIGIAMDTEDGLFVPVINNTNSKSEAQLRIELNQLKKDVSSRVIKKEQMQGFSFILSNFGKFCGKYANPIVVPPSVAILGAGKLHTQVIPIDEKPTISQVLPLSLTFDHRACTGGEATRFLGHVLMSLEKNSV